ncbi:MAG: branched-chain amino acid ABC transporter permease [Desulfomonile tiedjei]|uniref:Branched-chain amino acid ABC transporter permease n=1 Tax=Desulfomonile tiedjei TaxID=2358 RepID=A0A9D6V699_9BACT|nr:branched-chain amino acid ABC transporter permease [Desulfomonile tiedjei]
MSYLPCGVYFENYREDQRWWRTGFIKGKMVLMAVLLFAFPALVDSQWLSVAYTINYYILAALGVQLLVGYCGQITLGHAAFVAVGAYCSAMMVLFIPWPQFLVDAGLSYPISMICAGFAAGLWSVLFGLPSARVKGFYLIMTTMAAQWITVPLVITQYVSQIGGRGQAFSIPPGTIKVGPIELDASTQIGSLEITGDMKIYYFSVILVALCLLAMGNLLRSKMGRAWIAIRDNDIAAETMGVNIVAYKLLAFFTAGFFAGIAGAFYVSTLSFVSPEHYEWFYSLLWVGIILIGGVGSIQGLVFGSAFVVLVFKVLEMSVLGFSDFVMQSYPNLGWMTTKIIFFKESAFGLAIIFFLMYEPNGLSYRYWQLKNYFNLWPFSYTGK